MSRDESRRRPRPVAAPRVAPGPLHELKALLYRLYVEAGAPTFDDIATEAAKEDLPGSPSGDNVRRCIGGPELPANQADAITVALVLARLARWDRNDAARRIRELWVQARLHPPEPLRTIGQWDPMDLGIHRALHIDADYDDGPSMVERLTAYVERDHDRRLRDRLEAAKAGESVLVVLVGESCTGKTRAMQPASPRGHHLGLAKK